MEQQYFAIGVITNTHNLKGEVRFLPHYPKFPYAKLKKVFALHFGQHVILEIEKFRPHKKFWLIKFKNYDKIDDILPFKGSSVLIESKGAPSLGKDHYYWEQLIGCTLINHRKEAYGQVTGILPSSGHPVYVVDTGLAYERMVPAAPEFIAKVDLKKKKIFLTEKALPVLE
jgi:16S rRNA processing protein RimM